MDVSVELHDLKESFVASFGVTHEMMHVQAGLAIYVGVQLLQGTRRGSMLALNVVTAAEVLNELADVLAKGWFLRDTVSDVLLTLAWPLILTVVSQYRRDRWERSRAGYRFRETALATKAQIANVTRSSRSGTSSPWEQV